MTAENKAPSPAAEGPQSIPATDDSPQPRPYASRRLARLKALPAPAPAEASDGSSPSVQAVEAELIGAYVRGALDVEPLRTVVLTDPRFEALRQAILRLRDTGQVVTPAVLVSECPAALSAEALADLAAKAPGEEDVPQLATIVRRAALKARATAVLAEMQRALERDGIANLAAYAKALKDIVLEDKAGTTTSARDAISGRIDWFKLFAKNTLPPPTKDS